MIAAMGKDIIMALPISGMGIHGDVLATLFDHKA
jgi:hypothetical protein